MIWHTTLCYPHPKKSSSEKSMEGIVGNRIFLHKLSDLVLSCYKWEFLPLAHIFLMWSPVTMQFGDITGVQLCWKSISLGWAWRPHSLASLHSLRPRPYQDASLACLRVGPSLSWLCPNHCLFQLFSSHNISQEWSSQSAFEGVSIQLD